MADDIKNIELNFSCSEDFDKMPCVDKDGKQRHCSGCNKTVHDFTESSDTEMQKVMQQNNGNICGRFSLSQMSKNYLIAQAASLGITLSSLYACNEEYLQKEKVRKAVGIISCPKIEPVPLLGKVIYDSNIQQIKIPKVVDDSLVTDYLNSADLTSHVTNLCHTLTNNKNLKVKLRINSKGRIYGVYIQSKNLTAKERSAMQIKLLYKLKNVVAAQDASPLLVMCIH
jgi:hypothetical protein